MQIPKKTCKEIRIGFFGFSYLLSKTKALIPEQGEAA